MGLGGGIIRCNPIFALLFALGLGLLVSPFAMMNDGGISDSIKTHELGLNHDTQEYNVAKNPTTYAASYVYKKVKVVTKYKKKYRYHGKWRYKWVYKVKYVYKKYKVTSKPKITNYSPSQCLKPAKNCQSTSSTVKLLATSITKPVVYNVTTNVTNSSTETSSSVETGTCSTVTCSTSSSVPDSSSVNASETGSQVSYTLMTKTLSTYQKAEAIFNWARDELEYQFYFNTRKGALGTITSGSGNCCDLSHAIVALARSIGIPARYVYGSCKFSSGTLGHVWAQLYVNGQWYNADASNNMNSFGVIRNWNTNSWTLKGIYNELPF